jgi:hypothetical protein
MLDIADIVEKLKEPEVIAAIIGGIFLAILWRRGTRPPPPTPDKSHIVFFRLCMDRPALKTTFDQERSQEDFCQAIEDTITALNTGTLQNRKNSTVLAQGPSRHTLQNKRWYARMEQVVTDLQDVKSIYVDAKRRARIEVDERDGTYYMRITDPKVVPEIDKARLDAVKTFNTVCEEAKVPVLAVVSNSMQHTRT